MPLNVLLLVHAGLAGLCAWCFAAVLNQPGMLLHPVYSWCYERLERRFGNVEALLWWKPLWGCSVCVAGQWGLWSVVYRALIGGVSVQWYEFVYAPCLAMVVALILQKTLKY